MPSAADQISDADSAGLERDVARSRLSTSPEGSPCCGIRAANHTRPWVARDRPSTHWVAMLSAGLLCRQDQWEPKVRTLTGDSTFMTVDDGTEWLIVCNTSGVTVTELQRALPVVK